MGEKDIQPDWVEYFRYSIRLTGLSAASHYCKQTAKSDLTTIAKGFCSNLLRDTYNGTTTLLSSLGSARGFGNACLRIIPKIKDGVVTCVCYGPIEAIKQLGKDVWSSTWGAFKSIWNKTLQQCACNDKWATAGLRFKSALKWSAAIEGVLWAASVGYTQYQCNTGQLEWKEGRERIVKRSTEAVGAVALTAAGAYVGTLICPGVGTAIGMIAGGLLGAFLGYKTGEAISSWWWPEEKNDPPKERKG